MSAALRTRLSVFAAALSGALAVAMAATALAADDLGCSASDYQKQAKAVLGADGVACKWLPSRGSGDDSGDSNEDADVPVTTPATAPDGDESEDGAHGDRDCPDFATQARAHAVLAASLDSPSHPCRTRP
jgi:hypothetical protein